MSDSPTVDAQDMADPDIRRFVDAINAAYAAHAGVDPADMAARRDIAERVRSSWRTGGPQMIETRDLTINGLRARLHRPVGDRALPVMLYIHGGGWMLFSIDTHDRLMREYAARAGIAVIGIDYGLSPEHKYPVALDQCSAALDWIAAEADGLDLDASRILVGGDSAGANLSVAACLARRAAGKSLPIAMLLNYGAFDPEHLPSYAQFGTSTYPLEPAEMDLFWENYVDGPDRLSDPLVAPLRADLAGLPPAFLAIAECDILADCNRAFAERLEAAGVDTQAIVYRGATHSFLEAVSISALAGRALDDQAGWLRERVAPAR